MNDTATSLFNNYLQIASKSPRVISASRPSSAAAVDSLPTKEEVEDKISLPIKETEILQLDDINGEKEAVEIIDDAPFAEVEFIETEINAEKFAENQPKDKIESDDDISEKDEVQICAILDSNVQTSNILETSSVDEASGVADEYQSNNKGKKTKRMRKKTKKRITIRTDSPTSLTRGADSLLSLMGTASRIKSPARGRNLSRPGTANRVKGHDGLVMENLLPVYSELVDGIFKRPIVVSILAPADKMDFLAPLKSQSPVGPISNDKSKIIAFSAKQDKHIVEDGDSLTEANFLANHHINRITNKKTNFIIKVYDLVESKEAIYEVDVRAFIRLRFEFKSGDYYPLLKTYYKPQNLSWWAKHVKHFLVIYVKPNSELSVVLEKNNLRNYVKNKIKHHLWMQSTAEDDNKNKNNSYYNEDYELEETQPMPLPKRSVLVRSDTVMSMLSNEDEDSQMQMQLSPFQNSKSKVNKKTSFENGYYASEPLPFDYWRNVDDYIKNLSPQDKVGKNWDMVQKVFASVGVRDSLDMDEQEEGEEFGDTARNRHVISEAWARLEAMIRNTPATEKVGEHWDAVERIFLTVHAASSAEKIMSSTSPPRSASMKDSNHNNRSSSGNGRNQQRVSSAAATESESEAPITTRKVKTKVKKIKSKKSSSVDGSLPALRVGNGPISQQAPQLQDHLLVSRSIAESAGGSRSGSRKRNERRIIQSSPNVNRDRRMEASERVKTAPLKELPSQLTAATLSQHQMDSERRKKPQRHTITIIEPTNDGCNGSEDNNDDVLALVETNSTTQNNHNNEIDDDINSLPENLKNDVRNEFTTTFPMLADRSARSSGSPHSKPKSPSAAGTLPVDPFNDSVTKYRNPRKREVINIIKKARKEVSNDKEFINRRISSVEKKLLESPFAQKFVRPPKLDNLMSDLSIGSWGKK